MPIAVLSEYAEKEYEPFDSYSRFLPAMPVAACFSNTALCTPGKSTDGVLLFCYSSLADDKTSFSRNSKEMHHTAEIATNV